MNGQIARILSSVGVSEDWPEYVRKSEKYNSLTFYNKLNNYVKPNYTTNLEEIWHL